MNAKTRLGPRSFPMALGTALSSRLCWAFLLIVGLTGSGSWLRMEAAPGWLTYGIVAANRYHTGGMAAAGVLAFGLAAGIRAFSTVYELTEYGLLVRSGFLNFRSPPKSWFTLTERTVSLLVLRDAESTQTFLQSLLQLGTVRVRAYDGEITVLEYVPRPNVLVDDITARALRQQRGGFEAR